MITVKFIVLLCLIVSCAGYSNYCKICTNHILCQYPTPGPGVACKEYDNNKFLSDDDIYDLVNQINERRNFIALGHSRQLPSAANMNKLVWSEELATFAQRWVDQCDPYLRPDKEDQCRDLEHTNVGQNVASILNPSSSFSLKSFIEMWFIHLLDYSGSVTYYDQFQNHISNYFTQLIWAETESVGCGRAKFNVHNVTVDRIVCNFSPKGNVHGKPIYSIGYPRTQCQNEAAAHEKFKGLCTQSFTYKAKLPAANLPVSSLLKILNLSNDSVKHDIDPIYNNMKQIPSHRNEMENPKQQIMRHIVENRLQSKKTEIPNRFWESPINVSRNYGEYLHNRDKAYSRTILEHNKVYKYTNHPTNSYKRDDIRKHGIITDFYDYKIVNNFKKCTRSTETHNNCENSSKTTLNQKFYQCTRRRNNLQTQQFSNQVTYTIPYDLCPCSVNSYTVYSTNTQRPYTLNCECANVNGLKIRCPNLLRTLEYTARSRDDDVGSEISTKNTHLNPDVEYGWLYNKRRKSIPQSKRQSYNNNRNRHKRDFGDSSSFRPFWQLDSYSHDNNPQIKALRYTTIQNKKQQKSRKYAPKHFTTESITINLKDTQVRPVSEKYLSFDELLHLRKFNLSGNNARRRIEPEILRNPAADTSTAATTATEEQTANYTANTPFVRMKHCTRKLTCTWTAAYLTDSNGSVVGDRDRGSRTPPGYVEGCTRTSTCTRDYMNRNKFPTTISSSTNDGDDDDDANISGDYCERRSLNLHKRNHRTKRSFKKCKRNISNIDIMRYSNTDYIPLNDVLRKKKRLTERKSNLSYGDLYYLVLNKIMKNWVDNRIHNSQCPCNIASGQHSNFLHILLLFSVSFLF